MARCVAPVRVDEFHVLLALIHPRAEDAHEVLRADDLLLEERLAPQKGARAWRPTKALSAAFAGLAGSSGVAGTSASAWSFTLCSSSRLTERWYDSATMELTSWSMSCAVFSE